MLVRMAAPTGPRPGGGHRRLLLILRILPELERSGDLAEHIASHAAQGLARWLTPRALSLVSQMGALGLEMWEMAAAAYANRDANAADLLRARDEEIAIELRRRGQSVTVREITTTPERVNSRTWGSTGGPEALDSDTG